MAELICSNPGCGKTFREEENGDRICAYHTGAPIFREGLKKWSCCQKESMDFDKFMKIPGCASGMHQTAPKIEQKPEHVPKQEQNFEHVPKQESKPQLEQVVDQVVDQVVESDDPEEAEIPENSPCLRPGCLAAYTSEDSRSEECVFHSGSALFHEGGQRWTCCKKTTSNFDAFLKIKGCRTGKHKFVPREEKVQHDWYQTQRTVVMSIFARNSDKMRTRIAIDSSNINAEIRYQDSDKVSKFSTAFFEQIDSANSTIEYLPTKIEITLRKISGTSWAALGPCTAARSWTTFGVSKGPVRASGSEVIHAANDIPVHLLKTK